MLQKSSEKLHSLLEKMFFGQCTEKKVEPKRLHSGAVLEHSATLEVRSGFFPPLKVAPK